MGEFLIYFIMLTMLGFITGVGVLIHKENAKYRDFMSNHPVLGWTATVVGGGLAWLAAAYIVAYVVLFILLLLMGHSSGVSIPTQ